MSGFIQGEDRSQATLFPERLDDYVAKGSAVRVIDVFIDELDLSRLGGRLCIGRRKINFSNVFGGQYVGIREVANSTWLVSFMNYDLGFIDEKENRVEPVSDSPLVPKVLPM